MSIRWKFIIAIVLPLLVITTVVMGITFTRIYDYASSDIRERSLRELDLFAGRIGARYETIAQVARSTAAFVALNGEAGEQTLYDLLAANVGQHELIYGSAIAFEPYAFSQDKRLFAPYVLEPDQAEGLRHLDIARDAYDYQDGNWQWYAEVREKRAPLWTAPYFDEEAGDVLMTTYSAPIIRDGKLLGVATVDVGLEQLQREAQRELQGRHFSILGPSGEYLAHDDPASVMNSSVQEIAAALDNPRFGVLVDQMLAGGTGVGEVRDFLIDGTVVPGPAWFFYTPIPATGWTLTSVTPEAESTAQLRSFLRLGAAGLALMIALAFVLVWVISSRLTRPIKAMAQAVSRVADGHLDTHIDDIRSTDELGQLSMGFNRMLHNLKRHIERESQEAALRQMVENELAVARETQKSLLPNDFPAFPERKDFQLHAVNQAAYHVAGDFFDYFMIDPRHLMFVIGDVSGKGVAAALVMAVTRTIIRNLGQSGKSPADILREANTLLIDSQERTAYVTMFLGCYNTHTGRIIYANAGHPPPFLMDRDGEVRECGQATGTIIGMLERENYLNDEIRLQPGETLVLFTDGFPEARSPAAEFYGQQRIRQFLRANSDSSPEQLCDRTIEEVCHFQKKNLADDITLLALKRTSNRMEVLVHDLIN